MYRRATTRKADSAVYATARDHKGQHITFRIGQPVSLGAAHDRWERLDSRLSSFAHNERGEYRQGAVKRRPVRVRYDGRMFNVEHLEVRAVDDHGRGLGSDRHTLAFPVPYRAVRSALSGN